MDSAVAAGVAGAREASAGAPVDMALVAKASGMAADLMNQYFAAFTLLLLPLEAAAFRLAFHRVGNLNYPEWLVITALLTVQTFVFWAVLVILHRGYRNRRPGRCCCRWLMRCFPWSSSSRAIRAGNPCCERCWVWPSSWS